MGIEDLGERSAGDGVGFAHREAEDQHDAIAFVEAIEDLEDAWVGVEP